MALTHRLLPQPLARPVAENCNDKDTIVALFVALSLEAIAEGTKKGARRDHQRTLSLEITLVRQLASPNAAWMAAHMGQTQAFVSSATGPDYLHSGLLS